MAIILTCTIFFLYLATDLHCDCAFRPVRVTYIAIKVSTVPASSNFCSRTVHRGVCSPVQLQRSIYMYKKGLSCGKYFKETEPECAGCSGQGGRFAGICESSSPTRWKLSRKFEGMVLQWVITEGRNPECEDYRIREHFVWCGPTQHVTVFRSFSISGRTPAGSSLVSIVMRDHYFAIRVQQHGNVTAVLQGVSSLETHTAWHKRVSVRLNMCPACVCAFLPPSRRPFPCKYSTAQVLWFRSVCKYGPMLFLQSAALNSDPWPRHCDLSHNWSHYEPSGSHQ